MNLRRRHSVGVETRSGDAEYVEGTTSTESGATLWRLRVERDHAAHRVHPARDASQTSGPV
ncbi:hypothetical protein [Isosphaera pallida]|uniref:hypothetical protein n=1 Tax=Isosphaera pallida TaxID=128 RepID=UPI00030FD583|nr:hypothetical protein [Isosphaera pallida]